MDKQVTIFVEGKSDKEFLEAFINANSFNIKADIKTNNGNSINQAMINQIKESLANDIVVYIIFDADSSFNNTNEAIIKQLATAGISTNQVKIFLFPNNQQSGCLEDLLCEIAIHKKAIDCFDNYKKCLMLNDFNTTHISKKSKMYAYREIMGITTKQIQPSNITNNNIFDFNAKCLESLKDFFNHISKEG